jgi:VIT family
MSMAAGEYVSVHSQADTEQADLKVERRELRTDNAGERQELAESPFENVMDELSVVALILHVAGYVAVTVKCGIGGPDDRASA